MEKNKTSKGITLIALIITVIIMLILAGVAISVLTSDGGLFEKTRDVAQEYENAVENENQVINELINEIDIYLNGTSEQVKDIFPPKNFDLSVTSTATSITVTGSTIDEGTAGIKGYQFRLKDSEGTIIIDWTDIQKETSYIFTKENAGIEDRSEYKVSMKAVDNNGNQKEATNKDTVVTTDIQQVDLETGAKIGDFVKYSVTVNGVTYSQWRILDFNNKGHMEIVCYNGPSYSFGKYADASATDEQKSKSITDYTNLIKILNDESLAYKDGLYGYSARHLGSDPSNPNSYDVLLPQNNYIKYYTDYSNINLDEKYAYMNQVHHEMDRYALNLFEGTNKLSSTCWLASRRMDAKADCSYFRIRNVTSDGKNSSGDLCHVMSNGNIITYEHQNVANLAPVVALEAEVKIQKNSGTGVDSNNAWVLTKKISYVE